MYCLLREKVRDLVTDQTKEWTEMVMRQMADEHELLKTHISQLSDLLKELMEDAQDLQLKELELRHEKYSDIVVQSINLVEINLWFWAELL